MKRFFGLEIRLPSPRVLPGQARTLVKTDGRIRLGALSGVEYPKNSAKEIALRMNYS